MATFIKVTKKTGRAEYIINLDRVEHIEYVDKAARIFFTNGESFITEETLEVVKAKIMSALNSTIH